MKTMIAYYSLEGHTEKVVHDLATKIGASHVVRVEPLDESVLQGKSLSSLVSINANIKPCKSDLDDVDFLIVATPVWTDGPSPFMDRFMSTLTNCKGKPFSALIETSIGGGDRALSRIRKTLERKGMKYVSSAFTFEKDVESDKYSQVLEKFAATIHKA
ncbi:MAG TPA: NAD(P)H-dependent oxidoreductase [Methanocella sp.]|nr:NAD(P)H-dependent oxidoreductase [Methanocella sp.]